MNLSALVSPFNPIVPTKEAGIVQWRNLSGSGDSLVLAEAIRRDKRLYLVVTLDTHSALRLEHEIDFYLGKQLPVMHFPDWETLPYDVFSPLPEIVSERLRTLAEIARVDRGVLLVPVATLMQRLAPRSHVLGNTFVLKHNSRLGLDETRQRLEEVGYQCVTQVMQHGEFAVRGSILDLFPMGSPLPYRIELFDEEVESIRKFDPESQRSLEKVEEINLFPGREFPFDESAIKRFRQNFRVHFPDAPLHNSLYQEVSKGIAPGGLEYYLPLFVTDTATLFDYLPGNAVVALHGDVLGAALGFGAETRERYRQRLGHLDKPPLAPNVVFQEPESLMARIGEYPRIWISDGHEPGDVQVSVDYAIKALPLVALDNKSKQPAAKLLEYVAEANPRLLFVAETAGHREDLLAILAGNGIKPRVVDSWNQFVEGKNSQSLVVAPMDHGLWITDPPLAVVTETQLSGERVQQRRRRRASAGHKLEQVLRNLEELSVGSPVVHQDHGVGRFRGLVKLSVGGIETEFLAIEYANSDKLYVPVASLHLVGRYSGADPESAPLHKLGGEQWQKAKRRALERARDVAAELLDVYAKRAARKGVSLAARGEEYAVFAAAFPFEETPDQAMAITDVIGDMASNQPMDRVICGDVGFGKTEVAMRAAFVAVQNGKQVAVLAPTTLLTQQHFQNFRDRYADWPIRVEAVSRFVGKKQIAQLMEDLAAGKIDILIGTHKLLQKDVQFRDLGLVIVDEEHRFGVAQKEHFKKLRSEVDFLTLTATPIPRTLNLALSGLRDISIIATPPPNRHAIKTFVTEWDGGQIQEAILREIKRGGQVYFLHNKIETMEKMARELSELVPLANIRTAHGQLAERELEGVMLDFYHQRFNVLLCTTIIESGIDVPTANTIIINRADLLGLAQLHQIRGRVGRSHHRAYAYLIAPPKSLMTGDAVKRLEAIEATGELGAGFMLSSHDLEIRGAGELLGDEQSGQIQEIGLTLYTELLERAVKALRSGSQPDLDALPREVGPEIDMQSPALIPDTYLNDVHGRLVLYKRIANAKDDEDLRELQVEMIDRFGLLPPPTKVLFAVTALKLKAERIGIRKIEAGSAGGRILFHPDPNIEPVSVIRLLQSDPKRYKLDGPDRLRFNAALDTPDARIEFVESVLQQLVADNESKAEPTIH